MFFGGGGGGFGGVVVCAVLDVVAVPAMVFVSLVSLVVVEVLLLGTFFGVFAVVHGRYDGWIWKALLYMNGWMQIGHIE